MYHSSASNCAYHILDDNAEYTKSSTCKIKSLFVCQIPVVICNQNVRIKFPTLGNLTECRYQVPYLSIPSSDDCLHSTVK